jgi:ankyrin repeat protein
LAQRYQVDHLIDSLLSFDPAVDHLGTKPPTRKVPRPPKQEKIEDDEEEISPQFEYPMARTTPARSRQHSTASALSPPTFSNQQEPTPTYYQEVTQQDAENYVPSLVAKRLFDEELTQRDFFDSVYSKRSRVRTTTTDSVQRDVPVIDKTTDFSHLSRDQKNRELMLHLFVEQDSELNTQNFVGLIRDKVEPNTLLVNLILDEQEHTLLHWAASCGRIEIVRLLVHHGVKVNIPAKGGVTPLMKAIESNRNYANQSMDELLTMLGPSLFTADESGRTALHHAAALSRYRSKRAMSSYYMQCIARYIEDTRSATNSPTIAFVDTADNSQDTALHIACRYRNHKCVMLLLQLGASKDLKNNNEETAQDLCKYDYRLLRLMVFNFNVAN